MSQLSYAKSTKLTQSKGYMVTHPQELSKHNRAITLTDPIFLHSIGSLKLLNTPSCIHHIIYAYIHTLNHKLVQTQIFINCIQNFQMMVRVFIFLQFNTNTNMCTYVKSICKYCMFKRWESIVDDIKSHVCNCVVQSTNHKKTFKTLTCA